MTRRAWLVLLCAVFFALIAGGIYLSQREIAPVIVEMPAELITADELFPWVAEEDSLLAKAPLEPLSEIPVRPLLDMPGLKRRAEVRGAQLAFILYSNVIRREEAFYEYFGIRKTLEPEETFKLPLRGFTVLSNGREVYRVKKNGEMRHMVPEEFWDAVARARGIIQLPEE
ncbi:hypothetical protein HQ544_04425 [Candidatus Falkowbacteria bacterium]|nr:hypothetical protein [Candidatus Falkowbacteria bacterium]